MSELSQTTKIIFRRIAAVVSGSMLIGVGTACTIEDVVLATATLSATMIAAFGVSTVSVWLVIHRMREDEVGAIVPWALMERLMIGVFMGAVTLLFGNPTLGWIILAVGLLLVAFAAGDALLRPLPDEDDEDEPQPASR